MLRQPKRKLKTKLKQLVLFTVSMLQKKGKSHILLKVKISRENISLGKSEVTHMNRT